MKSYKNPRAPFLLALTLALAISLAGCGTESKPDKPKYDPEKLAVNTISFAELTDRERLLLGEPRGTDFVFDFNADESYGELAIWMERYDFGVLAKDRTFDMSQTLRSSDDGTNPMRGTIVFSMSPVVNEDGRQTGGDTIRVAVAKGHGSSAINIPPIAKPEGMAWSSGSGLDRETPLGGEIKLAQIMYSSSDEITVIFNDVADEESELIKDYDITYVLKCEFIKKTEMSSTSEKSVTITNDGKTAQTSAPSKDAADIT